MEGNGENTVREIKCFLHAVAVVNVDINIEHTRMISTITSVAELRYEQLVSP